MATGQNNTTTDTCDGLKIGDLVTFNGKVIGESPGNWGKYHDMVGIIMDISQPGAWSTLFKQELTIHWSDGSVATCSSNAVDKVAT